MPTLEASQGWRPCLDGRDLELRRVDTYGVAQAGWAADGGLSVHTDAGGLYVLVDATQPTTPLSDWLFFARRAAAPAVSWPRACREVHRLPGGEWACDGALFDGSTELSSNGAERWLSLPDASVLVSRRDGVFVLASDEVGSDAGMRLTDLDGIEAWATDETGVSLAVDGGFYDCSWQGVCSFLGQRFVAGPQVKLEDQRIVDVIRRQGRTFFSAAPAAVPICDVGARSCVGWQAGHVVARRGDTGFVASTIFQEGVGVVADGLTWDGGWVPARRGFQGPVDFGIAAGFAGSAPSSLIYWSPTQMLYWRFDGSGEPYDVIEAADLGSIVSAGAEPGFFWVSVAGPPARTDVFADEP